MAFLAQNICINFIFHSTIPTPIVGVRATTGLLHATMPPDMRQGDADSMPMVPTDSRKSRCHHDSDSNARALDLALCSACDQGL